jgi:hypothetical protein
MGVRRSNRVPAKKGLKKVLFPSQPPPANRPPPAKKMVSKKLPLKDISNKVLAAVRAIATPADLRSPKAPIVNPYARKKGPSMVDSKPAAVALVAPANKASSETEVHQTVEPAILAPVVALASTVSSNTANTLEGIVNGVSTRGQILSDKETLAFAHSVVYKKTIGNISTDVDGKVLVEPFKSTTNPFGENINDLHAWASYVINQDDLFGEETANIKNNTGNKTENDKAKVSQVARFLRSVRDHPQLGALADLIEDDEGGKTIRFLPLVRGLKTEVKAALMNTIFCIWSFNFHFIGRSKDSPNSTYQPNYTDKVARQIWKVLHDQGVTMNHSDFQHYTGSYWAYFKGKFAITVRVRSDFARNPLRAGVEYDDEVKMRSSNLDILHCYATLLLVAIYKVSRDWCTRGGDEVRFFDLFQLFFYFLTSILMFLFANSNCRLSRSEEATFLSAPYLLVP